MKARKKSSWDARVRAVKEQIERISPTFCTAKWLQTTLLLQNGNTQSCHHVRAHKVSIDSIRRNPSKLHNTSYKSLQREIMRKGGRPAECAYCWQVEDAGNCLSDRIVKSSDSWSEPYIEKLQTPSTDNDVEPTYVEISFSNLCNFACAYCYPDISSRVYTDLQINGPYPVSEPLGISTLQKRRRVPMAEDGNPYIEAFWAWLPSIIKSLHVLRVTGGEPLLHQSTHKLLKYLQKNPSPNLHLSINSNLGVKEELIENIVVSASDLQTGGKIKSWDIFTSVDATGEQAEYLRDGLDYKRWLQNCSRILETRDNFELTIMITFNVLSLPSFRDLLGDVLKLKKEYALDNGSRVKIDISHLQNPSYLSARLWPPGSEIPSRDWIFYAEQNSQAKGVPGGFHDDEIEKIRRLHIWLTSRSFTKKTIQELADFAKFIAEFDKRRKKVFITVFPEAAEFLKWSQSCAGIPPA